MGCFLGVVRQVTRGIRNNNPGNVRRTSDNWYGLSEVQQDDSFFTFVHHVFGIRCLCKILHNYSKLHGLYTAESIISRFAPPEDNNDTEAYIKHVCEQTGWARGELINLRAVDNMIKLAAAIIKHENGVMPYTRQDLKMGAVLGIET